MSRRDPFLLQHLIVEAAELNPDQTAFIHRESTITYGDLCQRATALASALVEAGVEKGDRVGILAGKSIETAIAVYGIMMAGAAYVPIDPSSPPHRASFILRDCGIRVLVSESSRNTLLQRIAGEGAFLDLVIAGGEGLPYETLGWSDVETMGPATGPGLTEMDICYILYTSGSTGVPKGIVHSHRSALSWANVSAAAYSISDSDIISNFAPLHFDQSTLDYFSSARAGATTVMIPEDRMRLAASLAEIIESEHLTLFYTVPTTLVQLARPGVLEGRDLSALKRVLFGGEPMPLKHLRSLMISLPHTEFFNVYGPTEVNGVTHYKVGRPPEPEDSPIPIGRPYDNVEALVIDDSDAEVPQGDVGELCVRTPTMMAGYWGQPDLNDAATYRRQRSGTPPELFHRTGDLVDRGADGNLHFHGRKDRQVKARGYRLELDEIEAALLSHPEVLEAAAYVVTVADADAVIHASVVLADGAADQDSQILSQARGVLPPYAVPVGLTILDELPRTASGKIDRLSLESYSRSRMDGT